MSWLSAIAGFFKVLLGLFDWQRRQELKDAGAAKVIIKGNEQADEMVAAVKDARRSPRCSRWASFKRGPRPAREPERTACGVRQRGSLSDGVPEVVEQIARSLGHRLDFETQSMGYSLLRQRTKGEVPSASDWPGYPNRGGSGLNVAEEPRQPRRLASGDKYDALVVTARHDLPAIARKERTAVYLTDMAKHLLAGNPDAEVLLYHTWLHLDPDAPWPWIDYERAVLPMCECVASRANLDLPARGNVPRVRVLPGGSALAELAAMLWEICPAYAAFQTQGPSVLAKLKRQFNAHRCARDYAHANDPENPFASLKQ